MLAVVHQATMTLTVLATADRAQAAARADRLIMHVGDLPEYYNIRRRFVCAPARHVRMLLASYRDAGTASAQAMREAATIAADVKALSRALDLARAAIAADNSVDLRKAARRVPEPRGGR